MKLRVLVFQEGHNNLQSGGLIIRWIAQGVDMDFLATGANIEDVVYKFYAHLAAHSAGCLDANIEPFTNISPAPPHFKKSFELSNLNLSYSGSIDFSIKGHDPSGGSRAASRQDLFMSMFMSMLSKVFMLTIVIITS